MPVINYCAVCALMRLLIPKKMARRDVAMDQTNNGRPVKPYSLRCRSGSALYSESSLFSGGIEVVKIELP